MKESSINSMCLAAIFTTCLLVSACATLSSPPKVVQEGETVKICYTCKNKNGKIITSNEASVISAAEADKSEFFLANQEDSPLILTAGSPDHNKIRRLRKMRPLGCDEEIAFQLAQAVVGLAEAAGCTAAQLAVAWVMANPLVTCPILGPRTMEHLRDNLGALEVEITPELEAAIDELVPPGELMVWLSPRKIAWLWIALISAARRAAAAASLLPSVVVLGINATAKIPTTRITIISSIKLKPADGLSFFIILSVTII